MLGKIAGAGQFAGFLEGVALAVVIVLNGTSPRSEAYDEGRVSERLMLAGRLHGLGSGTGWFGGEGSDRIKSRLGILAERHVLSAVGFGYVENEAERMPGGVDRGRKPLTEIVSYGTYGTRTG